MGIRYRVLDLPPGGVGAFTPTATTNPIASSWGLVKVTGSPGTMPVPAPSPEKTWAPMAGQSLGQLQPSNVSPDVILPAIYIAHADNMGPAADGFGMAIRRHTPLPVPAVSWISAAKRAMVGRRMGGRTVADNPRAFQRWPKYGG